MRASRIRPARLVHGTNSSSRCATREPESPRSRVASSRRCAVDRPRSRFGCRRRRAAVELRVRELQRRARRCTARRSAVVDRALADEHTWYLVNVSPDIAQQIEDCEPLLPQTCAARRSPVRCSPMPTSIISGGLAVLRQQGDARVRAALERDVRAHRDRAARVRAVRASRRIAGKPSPSTAGVAGHRSATIRSGRCSNFARSRCRARRPATRVATTARRGGRLCGRRSRNGLPRAVRAGLRRESTTRCGPRSARRRSVPRRLVLQRRRAARRRASGTNARATSAISRSAVRAGRSRRSASLRTARSSRTSITRTRCSTPSRRPPRPSPRPAPRSPTTEWRFSG